MIFTKHVTILAICCTLQCVLRTGRQTTDSMEPNFCQNDRAVFLASNGGLSRGNIVTFFPPLPNPYSKKLYPSRIIGMPGEGITVRKDLEYLNGQSVLLPTVSLRTGNSIIHPVHHATLDNDQFTESILGVTFLIRKSADEPKLDESNFLLGSDEYFLMIDNRDFEASPGAFPFGVVKKQDIAWKFLFKYWDSCKRPGHGA